jgi:methionine synthase / methylenetetrahydrofolate reductase(NADPH)
MAATDGTAVPFLTALRAGALVADGAMGTQLYERGVLFSVNYEELNLSRPDLVRRIHEEYVRAGANVIETNTFGANRIRLGRHGYTDNIVAINQRAVVLAREAARGGAYVVGAVGPSGLPMSPLSEDERGRVADAFREQMAALAEGGVDALLLETMGHPDELMLALECAKAEAGGLPVIVQMTVNDRLTLMDGTSLPEMGKQLVDAGADGLGINCSDGPQQVLAGAELLLPLGVPVSAMPNAGLPRKVDDRLIYVSTPEYFGVFSRRMFKLGVAMVGGCCGTTAEHIKRISHAARMAGSTDEVREDSEEGREAGFRSVSDLPSAPDGIVVTPMHEKTKLAAKIGKQFVVSVEVNPPIGIDPKKAIAAAKMLIDGGVDVINIADGARAQARMGNLAMALRMQQELSIETILHVCGRDRNLLAQVAHLLGASALGVNNLVIITGDPPKMGDFPDATAVYDLDSVGLLRLASRMNRGLDPSGKPIGEPTSFFLATGAEPGALNYPREIARLRAKKAAGAELVMTQPVYDPAVLERFLEDIKPLDLPVLVGLLPLASYRNAEFLHNEVPGMQIPDAIRERMRKAGTGPSARKEGVAIAREMLEAVHDKVAGAYVMPPLERYELALEVVDGYAGKPIAAAVPSV